MGSQSVPEQSELGPALIADEARARLRVLGFVICESLRAAVYFVSLLPSCLLLYQFRSAHPAVLLALGICGYYLSGMVFLISLVGAKKAIVGRLQTGQTVRVESAVAQRFLVAAMFHHILWTSPFRVLVSGLSPLTYLYYRGMGAKIGPTVFFSGGARIADPWFLEIENHATVGGGALILGHAGQGREIVLGSVFIGEGAVIGAHALILPDVRVGRHALVAAGAVVVRGTVIPEGETWGGVPARRIRARSLESKPVSSD